MLICLLNSIFGHFYSFTWNNFIELSARHLFMCGCVHHSVRGSVSNRVCLSVCLSFCSSVCLSVCTEKHLGCNSRSPIHNEAARGTRGLHYSELFTAATANHHSRAKQPATKTSNARLGLFPDPSCRWVPPNPNKQQQVKFF